MFEKILKEQKNIASKKNVEWVAANPDSMAGINQNIGKNIFPIHGLRHIPEGNGSGWFIWSGENDIPQDNPNFFSPIHIKHLFDDNPLIAKYLGLPPGWRFLIDDKGYEDLWFDKKLLETDDKK